MITLKLNLYDFSEDKPSDIYDGYTYLLCFGGWQWRIARWGAERKQFWTEGGDYIEDKNFYWAKLNETK